MRSWGLGWIILWGKGGRQGGILISIYGPDPLEAYNITICSCDNQNCFQILPDIPWEAQAAPVRTTASVQCLLQLSTRMLSHLGDLRTPQKEGSVWLELKEWIDFWWAIMEAFLEEHEPKRYGKYREMDRVQRATKLILKWGRREAWGERERCLAQTKLRLLKAILQKLWRFFTASLQTFWGCMVVVKVKSRSVALTPGIRTTRSTSEQCVQTFSIWLDRAGTGWEF